MTNNFPSRTPEARAAYRKANREELRKKQRAYASEHRHERAEYQAEYRKEEPEKVRKTHLNVQRRNLQFIRDYKKGKPCKDCKQIFPTVCIDFDHRNPSEKTANVSHLAGKAVALEQILKEIALCDLVCANCHRLRTAKLNGWIVEE